MADLPRWPLALPLPLLKSHGYTPGESVLVSGSTSGFGNQRRRFSSVHDSLGIKLILNATQNQVFDDWFKDQISSGADWFIIPIKTPAGLIDHHVHFKPPLKANKPITQTLWAREFVLAVRNRAVISKEEYSVIDEYGLAELEESALISEAMEV